MANLPGKSTEMFINMKDAPVWDPGKHYFDQKTSTIQFYEEEFRKIAEGVNIGGYHMHPWLYFHLNFFKTPIPTETSRGVTIDVLKNPPLDDNSLYISDNLADAEKRNKVLFLFGCRGFSKSSFLASYTHQTILTKSDGNFSIVGGEDGDLKSISSLMIKSFNNIHPAMYLPTLQKDWDSYVSFGYKDKSTAGKTYIHSEIRITNAVKGAGGASEKGAGLSPIGYIMDECGKYSFKEIFESALPSFRTPYGYRLIPILSGTSGNTELSKDAREVLENPEAFDILPMNFERLNNMVPPEFITWENDYKKKFGTFVPGQMSYRLETPRLEKSLSEFVGISSPELKALKIQATDWEKARDNINSLGGQNAKEKTRDKNKMYYPTEIDHCFLTKGANPFPVSIINNRIRELEDSGMAGRPVDIMKEGAKYNQKLSSKRKADVRHRGGSVDAPVLLFTEIPETPPERYMFVSGLDDYKLNQSDTDSLGAFYVIKRRNLSINSPCETIAASYVSRPDRHRDFHNVLETLIEIWSAECLMEAVDVSFEEYLELKGKAAKWLAPAITFAKSKDSRNNTKLQKKYGLFPTAGNNEHRMNVLVDWCWEQHTISIDENGQTVTKYGVEFLDDIDLLIELRDWQKGKNSDRKEAFSHALLHAHQLDADGIRPKSQSKNKGVLRFNLTEPEMSSARRSQGQRATTTPFTLRKMSPYSTRR